MDNEQLLKDILDNQKKQIDILERILQQEETNQNKYQEYLDEQEKNNEDYRASLAKSQEETEKREADRTEEHEAYMRGATIAKLVNYVRIVTSICLVGLVGYIAINGLGGS